MAFFQRSGQQMDRIHSSQKKKGSMASAKKQNILDIVSVLILVIVDQLTKLWAVRTLGDGHSRILIPGVLELTLVQNRGAAFGILQNARVFFFLITVSALLLIFYLLRRLPLEKRCRPLRVCLLMIASGAAGNFIDRMLFSYVRDFIYFSLINFPVFNVADIYITCATFAVVLLMLFYYREEEDGSFLGLS